MTFYIYCKTHTTGNIFSQCLVIQKFFLKTSPVFLHYLCSTEWANSFQHLGSWISWFTDLSFVYCSFRLWEIGKSFQRSRCYTLLERCGLRLFKNVKVWVKICDSIFFLCLQTSKSQFFFMRKKIFLNFF